MAKKKKQGRIKQTAIARQIEIVDAHTGQRKMVNLEDVKGIFQLSEDESREMAVRRATHNKQEAKHPFHHKTVSGVIVTPDPTLEYLLSKLSEEKRTLFYDIYTLTPEQEAKAPNAFPVNRKFYGYDMYEGL